jgi:cytochrome c-type biogenesis protein CcmE
MALIPKSRKARRRLMAVAVAAPVLALAAGLAISAMGDAVVFFYTPGQARDKHVPPGRTVRIGGLVQTGSVTHGPEGETGFAVSDRVATDRVVYKGALPDLFREGQGVVAQGVYRKDGVFEAHEVLAKHDEKYMPKEVADALKKSGEWRGDGTPPTPGAPSAMSPAQAKP